MSGYIVLTKAGIILRRKDKSYMKKEVAKNSGLFSGTKVINMGRMARIP